MKEKAGDPQLSDQVSNRILVEKYKLVLRKIDQWLVLAAMRRRKFHLFA